MRKEEARKALVSRHNAGVYGIGTDPDISPLTADSEGTVNNVPRLDIWPAFGVLSPRYRVFA
jgi:hypothetical protein